jgi:hypothetical protein
MIEGDPMSTDATRHFHEGIEGKRIAARGVEGPQEPPDDELSASPWIGLHYTNEQYEAGVQEGLWI